ncbi:phage portal protein [Limosilactobacillus fermentum]|uniref:phage portal protein n=1 Tax=Limosilactobacillus fermentum TaxID=1613 RepID=UPI0006688BC1|nr:phage portal protein [Limosilactobacillus fermentum]
MVNQLNNITDDPRISIASDEYERINMAKRYYKDDLGRVSYLNSYGRKMNRDLVSINVTKMAARRLASVIFNEQCTITLGDADATDANELIGQVLADNDFYNQYEEKLEEAIALGGGAIRPYVDNDKIKLAWVNASQFYPLHSNTNEIDEAAIASQTTVTENNLNVYYTLLEFHQWNDDGTYQITNELYRSESADTVGIQVPLNTLDEYKNIQPQVTLTGLTKPLFAYFKTPGANNKRLDSPLGLGLVDNSKKIIDAINQTHDSYYWEVKMGQRRVAVPAEMLKPGTTFGNNEVDELRPPVFDPEENVFVQMYGDEEMKITDLTTPIRNDQYQATMNFFLEEFENAIGLSQGTFTSTPSGVQTATEVVTNNSMTYQTRSSYLTQVSKQIKGLIIAILELMECGGLFDDGKARWSGDPEAVDINIDFADGVFTDKTTQFTQDSQAVSIGVLPKKRFLMRNYNLDEDQAEQWLAELDDEQPEFSTPFEDKQGPDGDPSAGAD